MSASLPSPTLDTVADLTLNPGPVTPEADLVFRPATLEDVDAVAALYTAAASEPYSVWNDVYPTRGDAESDLVAGLLYVLTGGDGVRGALSVVSENEYDGLPCWHRVGAGVREIARVVVRGDCHRRGYAALMMRRICSALRDMGTHAVHISVAVGHLPARTVYRRVGFTEAGEAELYGGQYVLMEKDLSVTEPS